MCCKRWRRKSPWRTGVSKPTINPQESVIAVVVTFNPDLVKLELLLQNILSQVDKICIVDNDSKNHSSLIKKCSIFANQLFTLEDNLGIAAAQNIGIRWALGQGASFILLLDQDSIPPTEMVATLRQILAENPKYAAVGPIPVDERATKNSFDLQIAGSPLVYSFTIWGPKRRCIPQPGELQKVPFLLSSGTLVSVPALAQIGLMDEFLFIDHVDLVWGLRANQAGYSVVVTGDVQMSHELGEAIVGLPGILSSIFRREIHLHSPERNYYLTRNTIFLLSSPWLSLTWKIGYLVWLCKYMSFYILAVPGEPNLKEIGSNVSDLDRNHSFAGRTARTRAIAQAILDGLSGQSGKYKHNGHSKHTKHNGNRI